MQQDVKRLGYWWEVQHIRHLDGKEILLGEETVHNTLTDEGEQNVLDSWFRNQFIPNNFRLGLTSATLTDTSTLATAVSGEPIQASYGRLTYARNTTDWPTLSLQAGDFRVEGLQKSFFAAHAWSTVTRIFLTSHSATGSIGPLFLFAELSTPRTLVSGDELRVTPRITAQ